MGEWRGLPPPLPQWKSGGGSASDEKSRGKSPQAASWPRSGSGDVATDSSYSKIDWRYRSDIDAHTQPEVVEAMFINGGQLFAYPERVVRHRCHMFVIFHVAGVPRQSCSKKKTKSREKTIWKLSFLLLFCLTLLLFSVLTNFSLLEKVLVLREVSTKETLFTLFFIWKRCTFSHLIRHFLLTVILINDENFNILKKFYILYVQRSAWWNLTLEKN